MSASNTDAPVLVLHEVSKSFGAVAAVREVSFDLYGGEAHAHFFRVDYGHLALDDAASRHGLHAAQARRWRHMHLRRQLRVRLRCVSLQNGQNATIDVVEDRESAVRHEI